MKSAENIRDLVKKAAMDSNPEVNSAVLKGLLEELDKSYGMDSAAAQPDLRRKIMKSRITKLVTAAAMVIVAVVLSITFLDKSVTSAYAVEQTLKAYDGIRYLHVYYYPCTDDASAKEAWIQYDENGDVEKLRANLYKRDAKDKHVAMVWSEGITLIWSRHANTLEIEENGDFYTPVMLGFAKSIDPKQAIEYAYKDQEQGKCQIEIEEGSNDNEPIKITARYLPGKYCTVKSLPAIHDVLVVDPTTKLVIRKEVYKVLEDRIELHGVYKAYDNQSFDPNIFDIEKEISDDAIRVVHYNVDDVNEVGIDEGSLSAEEADHVVIEEFFNALIEKDYKKAGLLFGGMPTDEVKLRFGEYNVVRLVSIGDRVKVGDELPSHYPCVVEIKENGNLSQWEPKVCIGKVPTLHSIKGRRIIAVF
jgi:hypothetical protein